MNPEVIALTELQYSTDTSGPLYLYLFGPDGLHTGAIRFHRDPKYPDVQIDSKQARRLAERHIQAGREVRICDGADRVTYYAKDGKVLHPLDPEKFWETAGGSEAVQV